MNAVRQSVRPLIMTLCMGGLLLSANVAQSQSDLENALRQYNFESVKGYIQPVADLFGANMNSGFSHSAEIPKWGFHFMIDIVAMGAVVDDAQKTYDIKLPPGFTLAPGAPLKTATVFGGTGSTFVDSRNSSLRYKGSDGIINTSLFPLAVPQLTIGYVYGTEATVRYVALPEFSDGKFPKTALFGIGGRHSVSQYIPQFPLDLAISVFYNKFTLGDIVDFNSVAFGAQAGKRFAVLVLYGGLQYEKSRMNLSYKSSDPTAPPVVDITLDGANTFRGTVGIGLALGILNLFADANFGQVTAVSGGIGFGF